MKILFDFRIYECSLSRGIGRYIYCLVDHILKNFPEIEISILKVNRDEKPIFNYNNDKIKYYFFDELENYNFNTKFDFYFLDDILSMGGNKIKFLDTFFNDLFPEKILKNSKRVVSIGYDLVPLLFHNIYLLDNNLINKYLCHLETIYIQDAIFVISESTKNDFVKYINIDANKIINIYGGFDPKFNNLNLDDYDFKIRNNSIVFISVYEDPRKNVFRLIRGFSKAYYSGKIPKDSKLYLCGKVSEYFSNIVEKEIVNNNLTKDNIVITGYISDEKLIELISHSKANILPSIYEGLGLSILESYACNTPSFASNISSTKELVLEECSFDPYDENDISNSIIKALTDEELFNKSLIFGKKLLEEKCNWDIVSKKVIEKLKELSNRIEKNTAIFGVLPPENSGIANYNAKTFGLDSNFHIFSSFKNYDNFNIANSYISNDFKNNFIPIEYYDKFLDKYTYKKNIFVLGNSIHNLEYLKYAITEKNKERSYLYLHDINLLFLLYSFLNNDINKFIKLIVKYYGEEIYSKIKELKNIREMVSILSNNKINGVKIIISLTNISNIIVNNESAKELLIHEMKYSLYKINIIKMFHPIENLTHIVPKYSKTKDIIYIGSFGIPDDNCKSTDIIIESINILNNKYKKNNKKIILLLAGYGMKDYINAFNNKKLLNNVIYYDSPEINELFSIMMSTEISIQLRNVSYGQTSGIICQLLGMGKKIIVTEDILPFDEAKYFCRSVKKNITANELALEITSFLDKKINIKPKEILDIYSFEKLSSDISFL
ncbi:glycosyltransferase family 4 protein [Brachyspira pilosicoli]|uniref:glycosyltransferase family 4 protein n=2 Tax=Brachyspira pilosicoli TaxID=52584 RepID=UPI0012F6E4CC|nr:glycosyltransferase family 1 protein [Brachyspira pilosicoli]